VVSALIFLTEGIDWKKALLGINHKGTKDRERKTNSSAKTYHKKDKRAAKIWRKLT
jgi:hypothetical protein